MTIGERIREIRKTEERTLDEFGEMIGLKKSALSMIENGKSNVTDQTMKLICREFGINESWLRDGTGEMHSKPDAGVMELAAQLSDDPFVRAVLVEYSKLDDGNRMLFRKFVRSLSDRMQGEEDAEPTVEELEEEYKKSASVSARKTGLPASSTTSGGMADEVGA